MWIWRWRRQKTRKETCWHVLPNMIQKTLTDWHISFLPVDLLESQRQWWSGTSQPWMWCAFGGSMLVFVLRIDLLRLLPCHGMYMSLRSMDYGSTCNKCHLPGYDQEVRSWHATLAEKSRNHGHECGTITFAHYVWWWSRCFKNFWTSSS